MLGVLRDIGTRLEKSSAPFLANEVPFGRRCLIGRCPLLRRFEIRADLRFEDDIGEEHVARRRARNQWRRRFQRHDPMPTEPIEDERERLALRVARCVTRPIGDELRLGHARERSIGETDRRPVIMDVDDGSRRPRYRSVP